MSLRRPLLALGVLTALAGCGGGDEPDTAANATRTPPPAATSTPDPGPPDGEPVTFRASDGVRLKGRSFGDGTSVVVLSHMGKQRSTEEDWLPLALELEDAGYRAIIYNRRGVCARDFDCSEGDHDLDESWRDVVGAVRFARRDGAERVALVGANYGAMASLYAVAKKGVDVDALVSVAGINRAVEPYMFTRADLRRVGARSLFVSADEDHHNADEVAREWAAWSGGELMMLESDQHGTQLLEDSEPTQGPLIDRTLTFLDSAL